jgi:hypothetical protein
VSDLTEEEEEEEEEEEFYSLKPPTWTHIDH